MGVLAVVMTVVIGIICYKNKKQQRTSTRQMFEIPQYAEILSDSKNAGALQISEHYYEVVKESLEYVSEHHYEVVKESREYVDVESSSQLPPMNFKMEKNVVYGVGLAQTHGEEGGEYEVVRPQPPPETPTESAAPHEMTVNVAYGATGHMM